MTRLQVGAVLSIPAHRERLKKQALESWASGDTAYARHQTWVRDVLAQIVQAAMERGQ